MTKPRLLAITADLMARSRIQAVADRAGWQVVVPARALDVTQLLLDIDTKLVVLDLMHPTIDFVDTIRLVRGTRWDADLVCFGFHTDAERLRKARETGAKTVVPNSELEATLATLMAN